MPQIMLLYTRYRHTSKRMKRTDQLAVLTIIIRITAMNNPVDLHTARCSIRRVNRKRAAGPVITRLTCKPQNNTSKAIYRRPRWLGRLSSCLLKSIRVFNSHRVHILVRTFFLHKNWSAESARAWVSNTRWTSTSSGNAEFLCAIQMKERTGGEKGRHLWPRLVEKIAEGKTSYELSWKVK